MGKIKHEERHTKACPSIKKECTMSSAFTHGAGHIVDLIVNLWTIYTLILGRSYTSNRLSETKQNSLFLKRPLSTSNLTNATRYRTVQLISSSWNRRQASAMRDGIWDIQITGTYSLANDTFIIRAI